MLGEIKVLIVDDDKGTRETLTGILLEKGYKTESAKDGREALDKLKEKSFNVALIDIKLPDISGTDVLKKLKEIRPDTVAIMITAFASLQTSVEALKEGAYAYILKPLEIDEVLANIREGLEKQRLLKELKELTEFNETIVNSANDLLYIISPDDTISLINETSERILGFKKEELMGREFFDLITPDYKQIWRRNFLKLLEGEKVPPYEIEVFDKNGDEVRLEVNVTPIRVGGRISELGVARDITERKKKEQEIKYLKESYEEIIKSSPVAIYTIDNDFTIRSWNPAMERLTGIKAERAINSSWYKFFSFLKEYGFDEKIDKVMRTKKPIELERLAIEFPRSARGFLKVKIAPLIKGGALIILEDVTERAKLERELAESEEKYKGLVENAGAGVYKHDREGRFIFANKKLADIYGHATEELLGHSFVEFISREDVEVYKKNIERTIKRLEPVGTFECKIVRKDGEIGTVEVTPTPLIERGRLVGFQGVITDITERKKLEQKIIEAKNEAEFLNDLMSHDINNANAVAIGTLRLLGDTLELDKKQERFLNRSLSAVHRSARLIDNVRKLQQAKAMGEESFMIRDLSPTLEDAIHDATALHKDKEVRINYTPKETLIYTDDLVKDLFLNLVDNAIKYDRSNKVIVDVSVEDLGENWKIGIEDRGRGVPDKMKEAIFNRYQRLHEGIRGSGIGLHLVRVLVERYNGKAWVEDRAEGDQSKGSIFYVVLPKGGR